MPDPHEAPPGSKEGGVDPQAMACFRKIIKVVKPDVFVHIGDAGEWESVSHWRWSRQRKPPVEYVTPQLAADALAVNDGLAKINKDLDAVGCNTRILTVGNHDKWVDQFVEENPLLEERWSREALLRNALTGWMVKDYGEYHKIGHLNFTHGGHYRGVNHTRATVLGTGANVMYGHTHDQQTAKVQRLDGIYGAWSVGCLCKLKKQFLKGMPTNWSHGCAIVHWEADGTFHVEQVEIFEGVAWVYGGRVRA